MATVLCAVALVAAVLLPSAQPVAAQDLGSRIVAVRASQKTAEAAMRAQDRVILSLTIQRKAATRQLKPLQRVAKQAAGELEVVKRVLAERKSRLAEKEALWTGAAADPPTEWKSRLESIRKEIRIAETRKANIAARARAAERAARAKKAQIEGLKRQRKVAVGRRESAEASLSAYIAQMTQLARLKIAEQANVSLAEGGTYSWPTTGRISQPYGCTGVVFNPRRGSCKHFHDGIDVVDGYGTPIRSVAAGVVAYSGWNPYDKEGRAYVVDVVHDDGFVSRYGHLIPGGQVKAGDLVHTGQVIGKMGSTGKSTGTHLHFELLRGGRDVNPLDFLPAGVVQVDKSSTKAGEAALQKSKRQADKAKQKRSKAEKAWLPPAKPFADANGRLVATCTPQDGEQKDAAEKKEGQKKSDGKKKSSKKKTSQNKSGDGNGSALRSDRRDVPLPVAVECKPTGIFAATDGDAPPPVPVPYRGADPAPG